jgi:hypothetical protein
VHAKVAARYQAEERRGRIPDEERRLHHGVERVITALRLLKPGGVGSSIKWSSSKEFTEWIGPNHEFAVSPGTSYRLLDSERNSFLALAHSLLQPPIKDLDLALRRFNFSYSRNLPDDRIVDFAIALESSLLFNLRDELKYRMALRACALLADEAPVEETKQLVDALYDVRSQVVHGNQTLSHLDRSPDLKRTLARNGWNGSIERFVRDQEDLVRRILRKLIERQQILEEITRELDSAIIGGLAPDTD